MSQEPPPPSPSPSPCPHLAGYRSNSHGLSKPLRSLGRCLRPLHTLGRAEVRRDPHEIPRCGICFSSSSSSSFLPSPRLYACLACASVSCPAHAPDHAAAAAGHEIAVDVDRAELFCCACRDQVYDRDFDSAVVLAHFARSNTSPSSSAIDSSSSAAAASVRRRRTRRRADYRPWAPDPSEWAAIRKGSKPIPPPDNEGLPRGLRGMNNLGNTCFMSSVLQALLHTPPLRNFFLSDLHNRFVCQQKGRRKRSAATAAAGNADGGNGTRPVCLACDLDAMYSAVFSGDRAPYSPAKFLYRSIAMVPDGRQTKCDYGFSYELASFPSINAINPVYLIAKHLRIKCCMVSVGKPWGSVQHTSTLWWQHASNLASYEQQDAHEFFISMLDAIHEKVEEDQSRAQNQSNGDCCIAHRVFSGILRSDVTCTICGFTSTTFDPCVDFSLDLDSVQNSAKVASSKSHARNGETESMLSSQSCGISTLAGCLDRFTRPERLGPDQKFFCQHCQVGQESLKQMSIKKLPLVTCFHIKRFEHSSTRKMSRKVDRYLQFPFSLNMARYLSSSILRSRYGNRIFTFDGDDLDAVSDTASEFELFAVITHSGKLEAGHYMTYLRLNNQWYRCDDAWITHVTENTVRASQAYMLFYVQRMLYYKASEDGVAL